MKHLIPVNRIGKNVVPAIAIFMAIGLTGGCVSQSLPPRITAGQVALLQKTQFGLTIGVVDVDDGLVEALAKTHLFARVDHLHSFATPPDLVAQSMERGSGTATIPIWTGLSFGVIPTTVNEAWGYSFSIRRFGTDDPCVRIPFVYSGPTTLGWWCIVLNMAPNRTGREVVNQPQFINSLAWQIVAKRGDIGSLKAK
jgi:hypothetical protein